MKIALDIENTEQDIPIIMDSPEMEEQDVLTSLPVGRRSEGKSPPHISINVEDRDGMYMQIPTSNAEVTFSKHRCLPSQDSMESNAPSTDLYDIMQLQSRRLSDDCISIPLEGEVPCHV